MVSPEPFSQPASRHPEAEARPCIPAPGKHHTTQRQRREHFREHDRQLQSGAKRSRSPDDPAARQRPLAGTQREGHGRTQDVSRSERHQAASRHNSLEGIDRQQRQRREIQADRRQEDRPKTAQQHRSQFLPHTGSPKNGAPKTQRPPQGTAGAKSRLSFSDELGDEQDDDGPRTFSLSASTAHRFLTERGILQINPMLGDHVPTFGMPKDTTALSLGASPRSLGRICFGVAQSRGLRPYMEDRCIVVASYQPLSASNVPVTDGVTRSFAAVVDGHNGSQAADHVTDRLHKVLAQAPELRSCAGEAAVTEAEQIGMSQALSRAFAKVDTEILDAARRQPDSDGATCVALLRTGSTLWTAHVGDSRAVMCRAGQPLRLTEDHKPAPGGPEHERVQRAGGAVEFQHCWRVICPAQGDRPASGLAVSRAFGDIHFKEPRRLVESEPEVSHHALSPADAFVVVASDGLWDVLSDLEAVKITQEVLNVGMRSESGSIRVTDTLAHAAANALLNEALAKHSQDNITVLLLLFQWD